MLKTEKQIQIEKMIKETSEKVSDGVINEVKRQFREIKEKSDIEVKKEMAKKEDSLEPLLDFEKIGQRVKEERINQGLSQEELAKKSDISRRMVQEIEYGTVAYDSLNRVLNALKLRIKHELEKK